MPLKLQKQLLNFKSFKLTAGLLLFTITCSNGISFTMIWNSFSVVKIMRIKQNMRFCIRFTYCLISKLTLLKLAWMKNFKNKREKFWHLVGVVLDPYPTSQKLFNWIATTARHFFEKWIKFLIIFKLENEFTTNGIY